MKLSYIPAFPPSRPRGRVLILGGGDGLAVRETLKYPQVESITLVDLRSRNDQIFSSNPMLTKLNDKSLLFPSRARRQRRCVSMGGFEHR